MQSSNRTTDQERRVGTHEGCVVTEQVWERPRRPKDPEPARWRNVMPVLALVLIGAGAWFAFPADRQVEDAAGARVAPSLRPSNVDEVAGQKQFRLVGASWGAVADEPFGRGTQAPDPTPDEVRERAFHRAAAERWKGVEIFVRRDR